jgi:hypothetical protein
MPGEQRGTVSPPVSAAWDALVRGHGSIVLVSSVLGLTGGGPFRSTAYMISKGGPVAFTRALAGGRSGLHRLPVLAGGSRRHRPGARRRRRLEARPIMSLGSSLGRALAATLEREILSGRWPTGSKLPTEREMATRSGVSRQTVREAFDEIERAGFIVRRQGSGTFVAGRRLEQSLLGHFSIVHALRSSGAEITTTVLPEHPEVDDRRGDLLAGTCHAYTSDRARPASAGRSPGRHRAARARAARLGRRPPLLRVPDSRAGRVRRCDPAGRRTRGLSGRSAR